MSIESKIRELPSELQDKIYHYYWTYQYSQKIVRPLDNTLHTMKSITKYILKHAIPNFKINYKSHYYYYCQYNIELKNIYENKCLMKFLLNSDTCYENIHYFHLLIKSNIMDEIQEKYKYFCAYTLTIIANPIYNEHNYHNIIRYFQNCA